MLPSKNFSGFKMLFGKRALTTTLYNHIREEVVDNKYVINDIIITTDINHIEKLIFNVSVLIICIYAYNIFIDDEENKEKKLDAFKLYKQYKNFFRFITITFLIVFFKNVDNVY
jgi:hypothetical protein